MLLFLLIMVNFRGDIQKGGRKMRKGFTLIELMIVVAIIAIIAAIAIPSLLQSKIATNDKAAVQNLRAIMTANQTFESQRYGYYGSLATQYNGFCKQTSDLLNATLTNEDGSTSKIRNLEATLCADEDTNADSGGYLYRYTVLYSFFDSDGIERVTSYMICAWPQTIGKTGTKIYLVSGQGTLYQRSADPAVGAPLIVWPEDAALDAEWLPVSK